MNTYKILSLGMILSIASWVYTVVTLSRPGWLSENAWFGILWGFSVFSFLFLQLAGMVRRPGKLALGLMVLVCFLALGIDVYIALEIGEHKLIVFAHAISALALIIAMFVAFVMARRTGPENTRP